MFLHKTEFLVGFFTRQPTTNVQYNFGTMTMTQYLDGLRRKMSLNLTLKPEVLWYVECMFRLPLNNLKDRTCTRYTGWFNYIFAMWRRGSLCGNWVSGRCTSKNIKFNLILWVYILYGPHTRLDDWWPYLHYLHIKIRNFLTSYQT